MNFGSQAMENLPCKFGIIMLISISGWLDERATKGTIVKVLSYNILAQYLLETHRYLYLDNDEKYLTWEYRSRALMQEFAEFDADVRFSISYMKNALLIKCSKTRFFSLQILCLQEVEESKLDFFNTKLGAMGRWKF
jgi:mRNA deadenylase 3'-5' endonuclease subunit Ccr4